MGRAALLGGKLALLQVTPIPLERAGEIGVAPAQVRLGQQAEDLVALRNIERERLFEHRQALFIASAMKETRPRQYSPSARVPTGNPRSRAFSR